MDEFKKRDKITVTCNKDNESYYKVGETGILWREGKKDWLAEFDSGMWYIANGSFKLAGPNPETFTVEEIADYIAGWASGPFDSVREIGKATLQNALSQLECNQDGISAVRKRKQN